MTELPTDKDGTPATPTLNMNLGDMFDAINLDGSADDAASASGDPDPGAPTRLLNSSPSNRAESGLDVDASVTSESSTHKAEASWRSVPAGLQEMEARTHDLKSLLTSALVPPVARRSGEQGGRGERGRGRARRRGGLERGVQTASGLGEELASGDPTFAVLDESDVSDFRRRVPEMAMEFPFELDDFQKRAVLCLERKDDVFVAAHTSAGKTVIAEYAVALAALSGGRVCYTSPIKSLSNQKFRDFCEKFESVGIVTGDVSIRPESQCLIMTTEILRSMLYRGDDMLRAVEWVIFDEVQFVNDEERGVVWETCILMLPPHVGIAMLSATVPNAVEFASWVGKIRERCVTVVSTAKRPVPLQHSLLHVDLAAEAQSTSRTGLPVLKSTVLLRQGGRFLDENFREAVSRPSEDSIVEECMSERVSVHSSAVVLDRNSQSGCEHASAPSGDSGPSDDFQSRNRSYERHLQASHEDARTPVSRSQGRSRGQHRGRGRICGRRSGTGRGGAQRVTHEVRDDPRVEPEPPHGSSRQSYQAEERSRNARSVQDTDNVSLGTRSSRMGRKARGRGRGRSDGHGRRGRGANFIQPGYGTHEWDPLVHFLEDKALTPTIVFCFSKKKCAAAVSSLSNVDLLPAPSDKARVHRVFEDAVARLQEADRSLPQIKSVREHLKKGIAAHHAGLLPIVKEVTEIVFSQGLVKVLFATERLRKHDGRAHRYLQPGEYTQMSGRAGRRGLDSVGHVFAYFPPDERFPPERDMRFVLTGPVSILKSAFRLTYNMILNVLRVDELRVEDMMQRSFSEAADDQAVERLKEVIDKADGHMTELDAALRNAPDERELRHYAALLLRITENSQVILRKLVVSSHLYNEAFKAGRVVIVHMPGNLLSLGVLLVPEARGKPKSSDRVRVLCVLAEADACDDEDAGAEAVLLQRFRLHRVHSPRSRECVFFYQERLLQLIDVPSRSIVWFAKSRANIHVGHDMATSPLNAATTPRLKPVPEAADFLSSFVSNLRSTLWRAEAGFDESAKARTALLEPLKALSSIAGSHGSEEQLTKWDERDALIEELVYPSAATHAIGRALRGLPSKAKMQNRVLEAFIQREQVRATIQGMRASWNAQRMPDLLPEYNKRVAVLQRMQYVSEDGVSILYKGRNGACEVSTVDSVILTEIVLGNVLDGLTAAEVASLLSALVCRVKNRVEAGAGSGKNECGGGGGGGGAGRASARVSKVRVQQARENDSEEQEASARDDVPNGGAVDSGESAEDAKKFSVAYRTSKAAMRRIVREFGRVQEEEGVDLEFETADCNGDFEAATCRWALCEVVLEWARGKAFADVMALTTAQEGDVVVTVKRLAELLKDARRVATAVGNEDLSASLDAALDAVRRDIIFSASLYIETPDQDEPAAAESYDGYDTVYV